MGKSNRSKKVLVVLPGPMGDAILCSWALARLRAGLPGSHITLMGNGTAIEVLTPNDWSDETRCWEKGQLNGLQMVRTARRLGEGEFDSAILLSNSFRSGMLVRMAGIKQRIGYQRDGRGILLTHGIAPFRWGRRYAPISMLDYYRYLIDRAVECLGGQVAAEDDCQGRSVRLSSDSANVTKIDRLLQGWGLSGEQRLAVLVPGGAFGLSKCWPAERFGELAGRLADDGYEVIVSCAPNEQERRIAGQVCRGSRVRLHSLASENVSVGELKELVRRCSLMVANDTGPCHIAAAFGVPLVTIFGPTDPRWTATGYEKEIRLRAEVDCGPCQKGVCRQDHRCMQAVTVEQVLEATRKVVSGSGRDGGFEAGRSDEYRGFEEGFVPLRDGAGLVHEGYKEVLEKAGLGDVNGAFGYAGGQRLDKPGLGGRQRLRVVLDGGQGREIAGYLKRYEAVGWRERLGGLLKGGVLAGVNDFVGAVSVAEQGVAGPRPLAYGQAETRTGAGRSFALVEELPQGDALERLLPKCQQGTGCAYALLENRRELIRQSADLVRRLHGAGLCHRDLYLSHIFLSAGRDGEERLCLIDLQRVFRPRVLRRRWQLKDLAALYYSAREHCSRAEQLRFVRAYWGCRRLNGRQKRLLRMVAWKARRIGRHDDKRRARHKMGEKS